MWTPARDVMEDEWRAAETSFACALVGALLALGDGRSGGLGFALLAFAIVIGINGLWIAWWNRYALGSVLAAIGIALGVARVPDAMVALGQLTSW